MNRYTILLAFLVLVAAVGAKLAEELAVPPSTSTKGRAAARSTAEVVLPRAGDGHFYVEADINGSTVRMLADTGASAIVLSTEDAERAGISVDQLDFTFAVSTANGQAAAAEVDLDEVRVGSIVRRDVRAIVTRGLPVSLLGMSFFNSLSTVAMEANELVLRD